MINTEFATANGVFGVNIIIPEAIPEGQAAEDANLSPEAWDAAVDTAMAKYTPRVIEALEYAGCNDIEVDMLTYADGTFSATASINVCVEADVERDEYGTPTICPEGDWESIATGKVKEGLGKLGLKFVRLYSIDVEYSSIELDDFDPMLE